MRNVSLLPISVLLMSTSVWAQPTPTPTEPVVTNTQTITPTAQVQQTPTDTVVPLTPRPSPVGVGLMVAGSITFGAFYVPAVVFGSLTIRSPYGGAAGGILFIPVFGPFVLAGFTPGGAAAMFAIDGLMQAGGLAMLITGAVINANHLRSSRVLRTASRELIPQWTVLPFTSPTATGLAFSGTMF